MPPFKDEHILIIAPGSQTTLAQLGLPESFTPARFRCPTRMFPGQKRGEWEPYKVRERPAPSITNGVHPPLPADVEMKDVTTNGEEKPKADEEDETSFEEDPTSDEGAVYPIREGRIVDWSCFFALLTHVFNTLSPPFHTPIMLIAQPAWTAQDHETVTQFFFEKFKTPAFCLMNAASAACYAYGVSNATVIDIGHEKVDVTAVSDFVAHDTGRGVAISGCGGEGLTYRLEELLGSKGFTRNMCEQLKKSNICEILPAGMPLPGNAESASQITDPNPASEASTGATGSGAAQRDNLQPQAPRGPGAGTEVGEEATNGEGEDEEGVLDVASIVASGKTSEYLARREKEKAEKAAAKKGALADQAAAARAARLPNSKRDRATFSFEEYVKIESNGMTNGAAPTQRRKRDIEIGVERFLAATPNTSKDGTSNDGILDTIAATINRTILSVPEVAKRSDLWDSLIILGNGSRTKGFTAALLGLLTTKYTLTPSSATIFTSELPSALSTPLPTGGTNTPIPNAHGLPPGPLHHPAAHGVNPLLVAATHANNPANPGLLNPASAAGAPDHVHQHSHHRSAGHGQTPTSIKTLKAPEYFPEWKDSRVSGMEEAGFLGAQVAAKVVFVVDQGLTKGFLPRGEYNEGGPGGIHDYSL